MDAEDIKLRRRDTEDFFELAYKIRLLIDDAIVKAGGAWSEEAEQRLKNMIFDEEGTDDEGALITGP